MRLYIGLTDGDWFQRLSDLAPDEVNFWQPSGGREFRSLRPGEPFLFKLHSPNNFVVGGGHFIRYSRLPASLAWDAFGIKNGVGSYQDLLVRVRKYRRSERAVDPVIGCNVLANPFFLPRGRWVSVPGSWSRNIVQGKGYDAEIGEGAALWEAVLATLGGSAIDPERVRSYTEIGGGRFGAEYLTRSRLGQGAFRVLVTDAYERRCAITGEKTLPVLEAAHIKPYAFEGPHQVRNGLLLRSDLHKLFDIGYLTVTPEFRVEVSPRLREEWHNGKEYYAYHGSSLRYRPTDPASRPSREFLGWHNEQRFKQ